MLTLITVFAVVLMSLLITRVATIMLTLTGMSRESARFQARSALTGTGFTTNEAESIVGHPVRRRIAMRLMLLGSAGLVTAVASLALSFGGANADDRLRNGVVLVGGLIVLWLIARSDWFDRHVGRIATRFLRARGLDVRDYAHLLELVGDWAVTELHVRAGDWVAERTLGELRLRDEGIVVLGVRRADGAYLGVPAARTRVQAGDQLVLYGREASVEDLDQRPRGPDGDAAHEGACAAHLREVAAEGTVEADEHGAVR